MPHTHADAPDFARSALNLASAGLGALGLHATDEFFASLSRMLDDAPAVFIPDRYDDNGKWMDGWETRRRRGPGFDQAVVRLAAPGRIAGFDVDTSHFVGNYPPACRIEACRVAGDPDAATEWTELMPQSALGPDAHHYSACASDAVWTHVRLSLYPDGGVARLRVYGRPEPDLSALGGGVADFAASLAGGRIIAFSDAHFGHYARLLAPGRGTDMGDGWETRRRREPGNDWIIVQLAARGVIEGIVVDTAHYKGNFPDACSLQAADLGTAGDGLDRMVVTASMFWEEVLAPSPLSADAIHEFGRDALKSVGPVTHVRLNIHPDGGVSRLRVLCRRPEAG